jgi:hypothetical protein
MYEVKPKEMSNDLVLTMIYAGQQAARGDGRAREGKHTLMHSILKS